jgi:hypothetical protein
LWSASKKHRPVELDISGPQRFFLLADELVLPLQLRVQPLALGNVLMRRDSAAIWQRADGVGDDAAVGEFLNRGVERNVAADAFADVVLVCSPHLEAGIQPVLDQIAGRRARLHLVR